MKINKHHVAVQSIFILSILLNSNEAKRISREKLARLLGQNPGVGFHQTTTVRKGNSLKGKIQYLDTFRLESYSCFIILEVITFQVSFIFEYRDGGTISERSDIFILG